MYTFKSLNPEAYTYIFFQKYYFRHKYAHYLVLHISVPITFLNSFESNIFIILKLFEKRQKSLKNIYIYILKRIKTKKNLEKLPIRKLPIKMALLVSFWDTFHSPWGWNISPQRKLAANTRCISLLFFNWHFFLSIFVVVVAASPAKKNIRWAIFKRTYSWHTHPQSIHLDCHGNSNIESKRAKFQPIFRIFSVVFPTFGQLRFDSSDGLFVLVSLRLYLYFVVVVLYPRDWDSSVWMVSEQVRLRNNASHGHTPTCPTFLTWPRPLHTKCATHWHCTWTELLVLLLVLLLLLVFPSFPPFVLFFLDAFQSHSTAFWPPSWPKWKE